MITHYTFYIGHTLMTKNRLDKEVLEYLQSIEGTLIKAENRNRFIADVDAEITRLNAEFNRCTPLKPYWGDAGMGNSDRKERCPRVALWGLGFITAFLIGGREQTA